MGFEPRCGVCWIAVGEGVDYLNRIACACMLDGYCCKIYPEKWTKCNVVQMCVV